MQQNPLVSVVMTTRNRAEYLKKAVASVFSQTYKNIELVIINDGSTDKTTEVISKLYGKDKRVIILTNEINLGYQKSLNRGIDTARGEYIARIDDDDSWTDTQKLEKQVKFLENHNEYVLTGGGAIWIDKTGKELFRYLLPKENEEIRKQILLKNRFVHSSIVFRKKDWESAGKYNEELLYCDWALWMELGKLGKLYNFPEYFVNYLKWESNITNFNVRKNLKEEIKIRKKYYKDYPNYNKAIFLGWIYYLSSFLPFQNKIRSVYNLIKNK